MSRRAPDAGQAQEGDGENHEQRCTRVDSENLRVGKWVAAYRLDETARQSECHPDQQCEHRARDAQVMDDPLLADALIIDECVPDRGQRDVLGADRQARDTHHRQ
jgi:hypothetical protein